MSAIKVCLEETRNVFKCFVFNSNTHMDVTNDQEEKSPQTMHEIEFGQSGILLSLTEITFLKCVRFMQLRVHRSFSFVLLFIKHYFCSFIVSLNFVVAKKSHFS